MNGEARGGENDIPQKDLGTESGGSSFAHPVCQQFPSFNALMFSRQKDLDHAHAKNRDEQTDGATKPRQCHPLCR